MSFSWKTRAVSAEVAANLHDKSLRDRGEALLSIALPDFRAEFARDLGRARTFLAPGAG